MNAKYDHIGKGYNSTRRADPYLTQKLKEHLQPKDGGLYLDIGCGTGNYTHALHSQGISFIGVDPSEKMLEKARQHPGDIEWRMGTAEEIGLPDNAVNGAIGSLTIHHWADLRKGFAEIARVVKPGGRVVIFTSTPRQMEGYWLKHYFPKMLEDSIVQMPKLDAVRDAMTSGGLQVVKTDAYFVRHDLQDKFLYCGKHDPKLYLEEKIRKGISSFSSLAHEIEVERGLAKLKADMESGEIDSVIADYANDMGDYLYLIGIKSAAEKGLD